MTDETKPVRERDALIRNHLRRSFEDKAAEEIPGDLMNLIAQLREQDGKDGK